MFSVRVIGKKISIVVIYILCKSGILLFQIGNTTGLTSAFTGGIEGGQQNSRQNSDDGNDYEKFNKSKADLLYSTMVE